MFRKVDQAEISFLIARFIIAIPHGAISNEMDNKTRSLSNTVKLMRMIVREYPRR